MLASTAEHKGLSNPFEVNDLIGAVINQITIDPGLKGQLLSLITHYRGINPALVPETTLPITTVGSYYYDGSNIGDVDFPVQPADNQVIRAWDSAALPADATPTGVQVDNISGRYGATTTASAGLNAVGLHVLGTSTLSQPATTTETLVRYYPGQLAEAIAVMDHLSGATMLEPDATVTPGQIDLDVGTLLTVGSPPKTAPPPTTTTTAPAGVVPAAATTPSHSDHHGRHGADPRWRNPECVVGRRAAVGSAAVHLTGRRRGRAPATSGPVAGGRARAGPDSPGPGRPGLAVWVRFVFSRTTKRTQTARSPLSVRLYPSAALSRRLPPGL